MNRENAGKVWTPEEREKLAARLASGMYPDEIANEHGRTAGAVVGKLLEAGLLIQNRNGFYYKINPDPWCSYHDIRHIDRGDPA